MVGASVNPYGAGPTTLVRFPGGLSAVTVGDELVLVVNWLGRGKDFVRYSNVVPPG